MSAASLATAVETFGAEVAAALAAAPERNRLGITQTIKKRLVALGAPAFTGTVGRPAPGGPEVSAGELVTELTRLVP